MRLTLGQVVASKRRHGQAKINRHFAVRFGLSTIAAGHKTTTSIVQECLLRGKAELAVCMQPVARSGADYMIIIRKTPNFGPSLP